LIDDRHEQQQDADRDERIAEDQASETMAHGQR
jgi:hypothetical protein